MNVTQRDAIELMDFGSATSETRQYWISVEYPDNIFGRGPFPSWLESSSQPDVEFPTL
jgi:hypothetical protein